MKYKKSQWGSLGGWIIGMASVIIISLIVWGFFFGGFGLGMTKEQILQGQLPQETTEIKQEIEAINEELEESTSSLTSVFREEYEGSNCFIDYSDSGLSDLNSNKVVFKRSSKGTLFYIENEEGQQILSEVIEGIYPCAVFGKNGEGIHVSDVFYQRIFFPIYSGTHNLIKYQDFGTSILSQKDYSEFAELAIVEHKGIFKEKQLRIKGKNYDMENALIYKADDSHICFVPTKDWVLWFGGCGSDELVDDACFKKELPDELFCKVKTYETNDELIA